jgi:DNA-binding XRE family transcriptional regulator
MKTKNKIITFEGHLDKDYGKIGTPSRDKFEQEFEAFKLGVILQDMRRQQKLTQEQLAKKCGTTKTYISRIENDASDIRLSTLMRIIQEGLGGHLKLTVEI